LGDAAATMRTRGVSVPGSTSPADPSGDLARLRVRLGLLSGAGATLLAAEATAHVAGIIAGEAAYGFGLLVLLVAATVLTNKAERRLAIAFVVLAIVRLLSLALPALILPIADWFALVGFPSLLAIAVALRAASWRLGDIGLRRPRLSDTAIMAVAGIALGVPGYLILRPTPLITAGGPIAVATTLFSLFAFVAVLEELLLRGLVQRTATDLFGLGGVAVSSAATALLYAGSADIRYVAFATLVATLFGLEVRRTGTVAGVIVAHTALLWVQLVILPAMRV
jgi:membrane protease YdiL (CAAX protease family)